MYSIWLIFYFFSFLLGWVRAFYPYWSFRVYLQLRAESEEKRLRPVLRWDLLVGRFQGVYISIYRKGREEWEGQWSLPEYYEVGITTRGRPRAILHVSKGSGEGMGEDWQELGGRMRRYGCTMGECSARELRGEGERTHVHTYVTVESIQGVGKPVGCYEGRRMSGRVDAEGKREEASGRSGTAAKGRFNATSTLSSLHLRLRNGPTYLALLPSRYTLLLPSLSLVSTIARVLPFAFSCLYTDYSTPVAK